MNILQLLHLRKPKNNYNNNELETNIMFPLQSDYKVLLTHKVYAKMWYYTKNIDTEWGGLLVIDKKDNNLIIEDIIFIEQQVSHAYFKLDNKAVEKVILKYAEESPDKLKKIKGWIHSHNVMDVFWSGEDEDTFNILYKYFGDYVIGGVVNKKFNQLWRIDIKSKDNKRMIYNDIYAKYFLGDSDLEKECLDNIKTKIKPNIGERLWNMYGN